MHKWIGQHGVTIAGECWGTPGAPAVVLLHGRGQTRHAWKALGMTLAEIGYFAVAFDARGHGDSDWAIDGEYGLDVQADDLELLLAAVGCSRPVLVGASLGGSVGLVAVGERQMDVAGLVLVDTGPYTEDNGARRVRSFMGSDPAGFSSLEEAADRVAAYLPQRRRPRDLEGLRKNLRQTADGRYRWHWDPRMLAGDDDRAERRRRLEACSRAIDVPVLVVRGELSDVLSDAGVAAFQVLCPQSEAVTVPGAAHMVSGDRNDAFAAAIVRFIQRITPPDDQTPRGEDLEQ